jgi:hypothetical protein
VAGFTGCATVLGHISPLWDGELVPRPDVIALVGKADAAIELQPTLMIITFEDEEA